jgi:hypothetical protein
VDKMDAARSPKPILKYQPKQKTSVGHAMKTQNCKLVRMRKNIIFITMYFLQLDFLSLFTSFSATSPTLYTSAM